MPPPHTADAHHAHQRHAESRATRRALWVALALTAGFAVVEAFGGWLAGSLALISDAGHMVTDAASFVVALIAAAVTTRAPSQRASYGYARAEVLAAFINALAMLALVAWIAIEAVLRLLAPTPVAGPMMMAVAAAGLVVNLCVAWMLSRGAGGINARGALLHVIGDLLGSVAALVAGAVIAKTGWTPIDPILSLVVALLILRSTLALLRESTGVLMERVPSHLSYDAVGRALAALPGVNGVHDLHVWQHGRRARRAVGARDAGRRRGVAARSGRRPAIARAGLRHRPRHAAARLAGPASCRTRHPAGARKRARRRPGPRSASALTARGRRAAIYSQRAFRKRTYR